MIFSGGYSLDPRIGKALVSYIHTHTHTHAHTHTPYSYGILAVTVGFQLPIFSAARVQILAFQASGKLSAPFPHSLWEEPAVSGTEGGGRGCGWGPSRLISVVCSAREASSEFLCAVPRGRQGNILQPRLGSLR